MSTVRSCLLCLVLAGCTGPTGEERTADTRPGADTDWFRAIRTADQLVLYEGLARGERNSKETVRLHDEIFYREVLEVSAEDREKLRSLLGDENSFRPWREEKKCGGFHPDYLAEWQAGEHTYRVLICFGCQETKVYGAGQSLRYDIDSDKFKELAGLLKRYRKNRPAD